MSWLAVSLALAAPPAQGATAPVLPWWTGRVLTLGSLHLGIRPAAFLDNEDQGRLEYGMAVTVQLSTRAL